MIRKEKNLVAKKKLRKGLKRSNAKYSAKQSSRSLNKSGEKKKVEKAIKKALNKTKNKTRSVGKKAKKVAKKSARKTKVVAKKSARKTTSVAKKIGRGVKNVAKKAARAIKEGVEDLFAFSRAKLFPFKKGFRFPEESIPAIKNKPSLGVAFSGGGTRSASATLGQLRGLKKIGILKDVKYISCVSGGAWTAAPFTYLKKNYNEDRFLGSYVEPEKIRAQSKSVRANSIEPMDKKSHAYTISESPIVLRALKHLGKEFISGREVDETYARAVGEIFLKPYGLDDPKRFFTWDQRHMRDIIKRNDHLSKKEFYTVDRDRPYLIGAGTLHNKALKMYHMEYTPLYVGVSQLHKNEGKKRKDIGGGYVEPIAFDSFSPKKSANKNKCVDVRLGRKFHRFSLADSIGSNGAAPMTVTRLLKPIVSSLARKAKSPAGKLALKGLELLLKGFPNFRYWPLTKVSKTKEEKYDFGDAGVLDSFGIMPLLKRRVKNIVVFINTNEDFGLYEGARKNKRLKKGSRFNNRTEKNLVVDPDLSVLFGQKVKGLKLSKLLEKKNQVFSNGKNKFSQLINGLLEAQDQGRGLVYKDTYKVCKNSHYGVSPYTANILWVYNHEIKNWETQLQKEVKNVLPGDFPLYKTFLSNTNIKDIAKNSRKRRRKAKEVALDPWNSLRKALTKSKEQRKADVKRFLDNCPAIVDLSPEHVELLAHMHAWNIVDNREIFRSMDPKVRRKK